MIVAVDGRSLDRERLQHFLGVSERCKDERKLLLVDVHAWNGIKVRKSRFNEKGYQEWKESFDQVLIFYTR
jgi:hypothetical protein